MRTAAGLAALGIVFGIAGAIVLFTWRITQHLTEMSAGMILGLGMAAILFAVGVLPLSYLLLRSRQADLYEFMASQSRARAPNFDVSLLPPAERPELSSFGGRAGGFNLIDLGSVPASYQDADENF